jgi:hypothetical protein
MDFTITKYKQLLEALINQGYSFQTFKEFMTAPLPKSIILRHDVDLLPFNSLVFAQIQHQKGIKGVYYFRAVPESWDVSVIKQIADLGHEIGYHYECLTTTGGDLKKAIADFQTNLSELRKLASVSTICMHGSPMSKYDSKDLWKKYNYKDYGILGEPYFDIDFRKVYYLTDTGRKWDGDKVSVRDRVDSGFHFQFHSTNQVIAAAKSGLLPHQIMFTFHPQRWSDNLYFWAKEFFFQNSKNVVKEYFFVKK